MTYKGCIISNETPGKQKLSSWIRDSFFHIVYPKPPFLSASPYSISVNITFILPFFPIHDNSDIILLFCKGNCYLSILLQGMPKASFWKIFLLSPAKRYFSRKPCRNKIAIKEAEKRLIPSQSIIGGKSIN